MAGTIVVRMPMIMPICGEWNGWSGREWLDWRFGTGCGVFGGYAHGSQNTAGVQAGGCPVWMAHRGSGWHAPNRDFTYPWEDSL